MGLISSSLGRVTRLLGGSTPGYNAPQFDDSVGLQDAEMRRRNEELANRRNQLLQSADGALGDNGEDQKYYNDELTTALGGVDEQAKGQQRVANIAAVRAGKKGSSTQLEANAGIQVQRAANTAQAVSAARSNLFGRQSARQNQLSAIRASILRGDSLNSSADSTRSSAADIATGGAQQRFQDDENYADTQRSIADARSRMLGDFIGSFSGAANTITGGGQGGTY